MLKIFFLLVFSFFINISYAQNYEKIDLTAKNISWTNAKDKQTLVSALTAHLNTETEKARAIASFLVFQMEKNRYAEKKLEKATQRNKEAEPPMDTIPFETRVGTSRDYALLFQELGQLAGLNVVTVYGYAGYKFPKGSYVPTTYSNEVEISQLDKKKAYPLQSYKSAWNVVAIDGDWKLIDTYWMDTNAKGVGDKVRSDNSMNKILRQRLKNKPTTLSLSQGKKLDENYFLADPKKFIQTHFPDENKWQLLTPPVTWDFFIAQGNK